MARADAVLLVYGTEREGVLYRGQYWRLFSNQVAFQQ
jgi:hypothetical protein